MPFIEHLREIRRRLLYSVILVGATWLLCYLFFTPIANLAMRPFQQIQHANFTHQLYVYSAFEGFTVKVSLSFLVALVLTLPLHILNALGFVFPGLTPREKQGAFFALFAGLFLAIFAVYLTYFQLLPFSLRFVMGNDMLPPTVGILLNYENSLMMVFKLVFYSAILFQFPILLELLMSFNLVSRKALLAASRYVILLIVVFAAIVTPPDFVAQLGLSIPMVVLYFGTILVAKVFHFGQEAS
ncbi:MAG: twin-arginine translocase subunit TatC [Candidatus Margulisiibacteriota bacterium]